MFKRLLDRFRSAPPPPPAPRPLPDWVKDSVIDWQRGDVAVCLGSGIWVLSDGDDTLSRGPTKGAMCKVLFVILIEGRQFLRLKGWDNGQCYHAACFDKLGRSSATVEDMIARHKSKPKTPELLDA